MPGLEHALVERYLAARPGLDRTAFLGEYHLLAAHRHTKIAGNFERLSKRDGKHGYLVHIPARAPPARQRDDRRRADGDPRLHRPDPARRPEVAPTPPAA